jgi:hypothetical protein
VGINPALPSPASIASPDWTILEINPDYHLGFEVGARANLNNYNIDIELNWERLYGKDSESFEASSTAGVMVGPFFDIGPNSASYKIARGKYSSNFDQVNLSFGKKICFFDDFYTHFFGGAGFNRIKQTLNNFYSNTAMTTSREIETSSTFTGAGPQIGLDYQYRIYKSFFFKGRSLLSLFMGQIKNGANYKSVSSDAPTDLPQPNIQTTKIPNRVQLIPGFEQKIGFSYLATWNCIRTIFEIGYQCQIYVNAVQTIDMASQALPADSPLVPDVGVFALGFMQNNSNFMLTGLYGLAGIEF